MINSQLLIFNKNNKSVFFSAISVASLSVAIGCVSGQEVQAASVYNYGEDLTALKNAYANKNVHILQIGDSHTAGDYFTEQLRKRLQAEIGDGGVGFAYSSKLNGQRNARHGYQSGWETRNSRSDKWGGNYPLGGVYASPSSRFSQLNLTSQYYAGDTQNADIVVNGHAGQVMTFTNQTGTHDVRLAKSGWQLIQSPITFPTSIQAESNMKVGGFWLKRHTGGGLVSAMGINGATQDYWRRWNSDLAQGLKFSNADLVILAYGTNEAFRQPADADLTADMNQAIHQIRQGLPNASILIIGAPESLKSTRGHCGRRSTSLDSVQYQLQQVAKQNHTLYWSWQDAMGGSCSMKDWVNRGLAAKDGVHFTRSGYSKAANDLYSGLKQTLMSSFNNHASGSSNYSNNTGYHNRHQIVNRTYSKNSEGVTNIEIKRTYREPEKNTPNSKIFKICSASEGCVK